MKLFHWKFDQYDYFIMHENVSMARATIRKHIASCPSAPQEHLTRLDKEPPYFVAPRDYPIVIEQGRTRIAGQ